MATKTAAELIAGRKPLNAELLRVANELSPTDLLHYRTVTDFFQEADHGSLPPETVEAFFAVVRLTHPLLAELSTVLE